MTFRPSYVALHHISAVMSGNTDSQGAGDPIGGDAQVSPKPRSWWLSAGLRLDQGFH